MGSSPENPVTTNESEGEPTRDFRTARPAAEGAVEAPPYTVRKENITFDQTNPNIARAVRKRTSSGEERRVTYEEYVAHMRRVNEPDVIEGSDSERVGTTWGLPGVDDWPTVSTPEGEMAEGFGPGKAQPTRNTGRRGEADSTYMVGSWSTIDDQEGRTSARPSAAERETGSDSPS